MFGFLRRIKRVIVATPYNVAHWLRDKLPFLWVLVEDANSILFRVRYGGWLEQVEQGAFQMAAPYRMIPIAQIPTKELVAFFHRQPEDLYQWFTPHGFDEKNLAHLQKNASFLAYVLKLDDETVAYFFLRCYCNGECYFGRLVDYQHARQGIGTLINQVSFYISESLHMTSFQTISGDNIASFKSCSRAYRLEPIRTIGNGYILYKNCKL